MDIFNYFLLIFWFNPSIQGFPYKNSDKLKKSVIFLKYQPIIEPDR